MTTRKRQTKLGWTIALSVLVGLVLLFVVLVMVWRQQNHGVRPKVNGNREQTAFVETIETTTAKRGKVRYSGAKGRGGRWQYRASYQETVHGADATGTVELTSDALGPAKVYNQRVARDLLKDTPWAHLPQFAAFQRQAVAGFEASGASVGTTLHQAPQAPDQRPKDDDSQDFLVVAKDEDTLVSAAQGYWGQAEPLVWAGFGNLSIADFFVSIEELANGSAGNSSEHAAQEPLLPRNWLVLHQVVAMPKAEAKAQDALKPLLQQVGAKLKVGQQVTMPDGRYRVRGAFLDSANYAEWYWFQVKAGKVLQFAYYYDRVSDSYQYE